MNARLKNILLNVALPLCGTCLLVLIWYVVAKRENNELILPYPKDVLLRFFALWAEKNFYKSIFSTLGRTFLCFAISFGVAMLLAILSRLFPPLTKFLSPVVSVLRSAPTLAVILILYAFLNAKKMSVIVGFLIGFPILYASFLSALSAIDTELITLAKVYKVNVFRRITHIFIPSILPIVFDSSRATLSLVLKIVIAAEIITLTPISLGEKIQTAYASFEISYLLSWTLLAILLSYALEILVALMKILVVRWKK